MCKDFNNKDNSVSIDKLPPQAIDIEAAYLGTCFLYPDTVHETKLKPEMFYKDAHRKIFQAILDLSRKGVCDLLSVTDYLNTKEELESSGGIIYLTKLTQNIFTDQMIQTHALIIKEKHLLREYIRIGSQISSMGFTEDLMNIVEFAETSLFQLSDYTQIKEPKMISRCVDEYLLEIEKIINKEKSLAGVASGFSSIDKITGGWQPQDLIIIAGRPSMGKTAVALAITKGAAEMKSPVAFFSLEMSESQLTGRYLSSISGRTNMELREGNVDFQSLAFKSNEIAMLPIFIDDTPAISLQDLRSKIKKLIVKNGIKLVVIDYLQLMRSDAGNREQEVSKISRGLKAIAKEFNVPVIALSQLNRTLEERADKKPKLSDLRESGAIEQDADIVSFIYRPAYYSQKRIILNGHEVSTENLLLMDLAKNRNGALTTLKFSHNESMTVISENKSDF